MTDIISRIHGTGGRSTQELIAKIFHPYLKNPKLSPHDAAICRMGSEEFLVTTDCHVVEPLFFPGGDIGKLAITGVINDLLTQGGRPQFMSLGFILEEGLAFETLRRVLESMKAVLASHEIQLLCADTKVVPARNQNPGLMIASTLWGSRLHPDRKFPGPQIGDAILSTSFIGAHGIAVLQAREQLAFRGQIESDCASLFPLLAPILADNNLSIHFMRDPTRGGVAGISHEICKEFEIGIEFWEEALPLRPPVRAAMELLGLDVLEVPNEGVMILFVPPSSSEEILRILRTHTLGAGAAQIGEVQKKSASKVTLRTRIGGNRKVPWTDALNFPRIC